MDGRECTQIYTPWKIHCSGDAREDGPWNQGNENTALNLEDVIENVIGIETGKSGFISKFNHLNGSLGENNPKTEQICCYYNKSCLRVKIHLVILLWSFMLVNCGAVDWLARQTSESNHRDFFIGCKVWLKA